MKLAAFSEQFGRRIKNVVESFELPDVAQPGGSKATILSGYSTPMEITAVWEQDADDEVWKCKAKRLWKSGGKYQTRENATEITLYAPCDNNTPTPVIGEKVFAIYRGVWEMIGGVGNGGSPKTYAIVMEAIPAVADITKDPSDSTWATGKIKIIGKDYDINNPVYDVCSCLELVYDSTYPEILPAGYYGAVIKAGQYSNPDYDPDAEPPASDYIDWYVFINTEALYPGNFVSEVNNSNYQSPVQVLINGNQTVLATMPFMVPTGKKLNAGEPCLITRTSATPVTFTVLKTGCPQ